MTDSNFNRRALVGLGGGVALATAASTAMADPAPAQERWTPQAEAQDAWLDVPGTRHRLVFDTISAKGGEEAIFYADNFIRANKTAYKLEPDALSVVIIFRHMSTPYGFNDSIWAKYGTSFADKLELKGKEAIQASKANPLNIADEDGPKDADAVTLATLAKKGVHFAVCGMATEAMAGIIAKATKQNADAVKKELIANMVANAVLVPAGIVTVNRAQEHGYAFAYTG